jgi:hypothetical protein
VWVTDDRWVILDTVFRVVSEDEETVRRIADHLIGFEKTDRPARAAHIIQITLDDKGTVTAHNDCRRFSSATSEWDRLLTSVVAVINNAAIHRCKNFAVHSSVVDAKGRTIALPATTGGGKTTLAAALVRTGLSYISDEALVLDEGGRVIAYPKPMALSPWSAEAVGLHHGEHERLAVPRDLGGEFGKGGGALTDVVVSQHGHDAASLEPIPRSETVPALLTHSFNHYKNPERAFRIVTKVAREAQAWRLTYGDPMEAAALIAQEIAGLQPAATA